MEKRTNAKAQQTKNNTANFIEVNDFTNFWFVSFALI